VNRLTRAATLVIASAALSTALPAQQRQVDARVPGSAAAPVRDVRAEARAWYGELQQISARLQAAHARAMRDGRLKGAQDSLERDLRRAMDRADPELVRLADRARALEAEQETARRARDGERFATAAAELNQIRQRFVNAQALAMRDPAISGRMRSYEQRLHAALVQVEPGLDRLLARSRQLQGFLARVMRPSPQD
jgi:hypothetical protein